MQRSDFEARKPGAEFPRLYRFRLKIMSRRAGALRKNWNPSQ
jgi:hypothetical protein